MTPPDTRPRTAVQAVIRRARFAPEIATFGGCDAAQATAAAYKYVKNTRLFGFIIELTEPFLTPNQPLDVEYL